MKIEIGESLYYSWLKHKQKCQIVQTNWKISNSWDKCNKGLSETIIKDIKDKEELKVYDIFKKNSGLDQIIKQAECDVIGIHFEGILTLPKIIAIDVAFHENGLNYGKYKITIAKVLYKCIRTALCILLYFGSTDAEIIFASPKVNENICQQIGNCLSIIQKILNGKGLKFQFILHANDDFKTILDEIINECSNIADTSELFVRSIQLESLFENKKKQNKSVLSLSSDSSNIKIGKLVTDQLRPILQQSTSLTSIEINRLMDSQESYNLFGLSYPLLVKKTDGNFDKNRYYKESIIINNEEYYLCNMWYERQRNKLENWINNHQLPTSTLDQQGNNYEEGMEQF